MTEILPWLVLLALVAFQYLYAEKKGVDDGGGTYLYLSESKIQCEKLLQDCILGREQERETIAQLRVDLAICRTQLKQIYDHYDNDGFGKNTSSINGNLTSKIKEHFARFSDVLLLKFDHSELEQLIRFEMNERPDFMTSPTGDFQDFVFDLISYCERHDRLPDLLEAALLARPNSIELQEFAKLVGYRF